MPSDAALQPRRARTRRCLAPLGLVALLAALLGPPGGAGQGSEPGPRPTAHPTVHEVRMLNASPRGRFVFEPPVVFAEPGDVVRFIAVDSGHGSFSIPEMLPEEAGGWRSGIGGMTEIVLEHEGVYGFRCLAHYTIGMVGLVVVGDPSPNLERARAVGHPSRAQEKFERLFELLDRQQD
jgi:pseudoazurin